NSREFAANVEKGRRAVAIAAAVRAMTRCAAREIDRGSARDSGWTSYRRERGNPRDVVRVDIEHACLAVDGRTAPLASTIESWEHDASPETRRREHALRSQCAKARERRGVRL